MEKNYVVHEGDRIPFRNEVDFCVGTGRIGLALQKEYMEQLALVQKEIGFSHIRGHGLFTDDMAIYQEYTDENGVKHPEYNFTYLDLVMDSYKAVGIRPFLELGFMPAKLASGTQTIFYWKGNTTPPKEYAAWCDLVKATLSHLIGRYGAEAAEWPIEVWNEPNLPGFWEHADMQEYFRLYEATANAVKEVCPDWKVGGPAICGVDDVNWMKSFLSFCEESGAPIDFVTRHHYTTELPVRDVHYGYVRLHDPVESLKVLDVTREIVDSFDRFKGMDIHITEFNTSYIPNAPIHDTNQNAAYVAYLLSRLGEANMSYSYWTFGDIFEEQGVPFTPFHGGFGLVANGGIPKPTFWSFRFFKDLKRFGGGCGLKERECVVQESGGEYAGIAWKDGRSRSGEDLELTIELPAEASGRYTLVTETVDEETCNPLKIWHDLGEPANPCEEERQLILSGAHPVTRTGQLVCGPDGKLVLNLTVKEFGVVLFKLIPLKGVSDRGYDYDRVMNKQKTGENG